jgi:hypothetical protein
MTRSVTVVVLLDASTGAVRAEVTLPSAPTGVPATTAVESTSWYTSSPCASAPP